MPELNITKPLLRTGVAHIPCGSVFVTRYGTYYLRSSAGAVDLLDGTNVGLGNFGGYETDYTDLGPITIKK